MEDIQNVDFYDPKLIKIIQDPMHTNHSTVIRSLFCLAICHDIIIDDKGGKIKYSASSPDEMAIVNFCRYCGVFFKGIDGDNYINLQFQG